MVHATTELATMLGTTPAALIGGNSVHMVDSIIPEPFAQMHHALIMVGVQALLCACVCVCMCALSMHETCTSRTSMNAQNMHDLCMQIVKNTALRLFSQDPPATAPPHLSCRNGMLSQCLATRLPEGPSMLPFKLSMRKKEVGVNSNPYLQVVWHEGPSMLPFKLSPCKNGGRVWNTF